MARPWRRRLLGFALVGLALAGTHSLVTSARFGGWLASGLELALAERLQEDVLLGQVQLELAPPRATVAGVLVRSRQDGSPLFSLEAAEAELGWEAGPTLRQLELVRPTLLLRVDDGAPVDFPGLFDEGAGGVATELPFQQLVLVEGALHLEDTEGEVLSIEGLELDGQGLRIGHLRLPAGLEAEAVTWPGARVGGPGVQLPGVDLDLGLLRLEGSADLPLQGPIRGDLALRGGLEELSSLLSPLSLAGGDWVGRLVVGGTLAEPEALVQVQGHPTLLDADQRAYDLGQLEVELELDAARIRLVQLESAWADGVVTGQGIADWSGALHRLDLQARELSLHRAFVQVGEFTDPHVDLAVDLEMQLRGTLSPLQLEGLTRIRGGQLLVADDGLSGRHRLVLEMDELRSEGGIELDDRGVRLVDHELQADGNRGTLQAWLPFDEIGPFRADLDLSRAELSAFGPLGGAELGGLGTASVTVAGPWADPDVHALVEVDAFRLFDLAVADQLSTSVDMTDLHTLRFDDWSARRGQTRAKGRLALDFAPEELGLELDALISEGGRVSDLVGPWTTLPGIDAGVAGVLSLAGPAAALDGEVELQLSEADLAGERFPEGRLVATVEQGTVRLHPLELTRADGTVSLEGRIHSDLSLDLQARAQGFRLERSAWLHGLDGRLDGLAELDGRVLGRLDEPEPSGRLRLEGLHWMGRPAPEVQVDVSTEQGRMALSARASGAVSAEGELDLWDTHDWTFVAELSSFPVDLFVPRAPDGRELVWQLDGLAVGAGQLDGATDLSLTLQTQTLAWAGRELHSPRPFQVDLSQGAWEIRDLALSGPGTSLEIAVAGPPEDLRVQASGPFDAAWLGALSAELQQVEGLGELDLSLRGPLDRLDGRVVPSLEQAYVQAPWFPDPLQALHIRLLGRPDRWEIERGTAELGGGQVLLSGFILAERWVPRRVELRASVVEARVEPLDDLPPMLASAELVLSGPADQLRLSGEIVVEDMVFAERLDWEQFAVDFRERRLVEEVGGPQREPAVHLDVGIRADRSARLRNNLGEGLLDADLRLVGDDTRIGLTGSVRMQAGGRAFFQGREFDVLRAELRYVDPYDYDPEVDVLLETQIRGQERDYSVSVPLRGPLSDMRAEPRSDPQLPVADINALLLFGRTREELERGGGAGAALAAEGLDVLVTGEGSRALDRLGPDALTEALQSTRVELNTGVTERGQVGDDAWRVLVETDLEEPIEATMVGEFSLDERYLALEKELVRNLYLKLFWSSEQRERRLEAGGAYGADVEVRWDSD